MPRSKTPGISGIFDLAISSNGEGGIRTLVQIPKKTQRFQTRSAESDARLPTIDSDDVELASVVRAWPRLSSSLRTAILALLKVNTDRFICENETHLN